MRLVSIVLAVLAIGVSAAVLAFLLQRAVLFPRPLAITKPSPGPVERVSLPTGAALYLPTRAALEPAPAILFAHGNAETADEWVYTFEPLRAVGWSVLLLEYPGYAGTAGSPSETSISAAARAAFDWLTADPRVDAHEIVAYGRSLGTGPASRLAADRPIAGLILESGFTSVRPLAARFLIPGFLVRDPFDNVTALEHYRGPLLVLHGRHDDVIPFAHGEALAAGVPGSTFVAMDCGHNDCPRPWDAIQTWAEAHAIGPHPGSPAS